MSDNPIFHVTGTVVFSSIIEPILSGSMMSDDRIPRNQWGIRLSIAHDEVMRLSAIDSRITSKIKTEAGGSLRIGGVSRLRVPFYMPMTPAELRDIREFNHDVDAALDGTTANVIFRGWMMRTPETKMFTISPVYVHFFNRPKSEFDSRAYCTTYPESAAK